MEEEKRRRVRHPVLLAVVLTALVTAVLSAAVTAASVRARLEDAAAFAREYPKLLELSGVIDERFVGEKDPAAVEEACAAAMVEGLGDRWSYYISAEELKEYDVTMANNYVGVGVTVRKPEEDDPLEVIKVQEGGGAAEAGVLPGDLITAADGVSLKGMTLEEASALVRGEEGTEVVLEILRGEQTLTLSMVRKALPLEAISGEMLDGIGYIRIENFYTGTGDSFVRTAEDLLDQGAEALVMDVRFNGGGYVSELTRMLDYLLPEGLIFHMEYTDGTESRTSSDASRVECPLAVLVNDSSYSAAEYFAEAIREFDCGIVGGQATTGKGYSQVMIRLSDGSGVNLSTARYFTPNGSSLAGVGIQPDIPVEVDEEEYYAVYYGVLPREEDHQLQAVLEALREAE
ncbi:MAG: PDZ domain-containing protein [Oscillospiraceae bacterium]|nr:PDZ domain-containing protein [Oscillospiraceae bacterium]